VVLLFFALFFLFFFLRVFLGFVFLNILDGFLGLLVFFLLLFLAQRLAVFLGLSRDFVAVEIEKAIFVFLVLGDFACLVVFGFLFVAGAGVVFLELVDRLLVVVDFFEQRFEVGELNLGFLGEIENTLADGGIDGRSRHSDLIRFGTAMQLDLVRQFQRTR